MICPTDGKECSSPWCVNKVYACSVYLYSIKFGENADISRRRFLKRARETLIDLEAKP